MHQPLPPNQRKSSQPLSPQFQLRPFQAKALEVLGTSVTPSKHLLCIAPTGSGKSLIYEEAALCRPRRTLLITPLIALARQQFQKLKAKGVPVTLSCGETTFQLPPSKSGAWILSPESLHSSKKKAALHNWEPNFLVVDECHCLWDWGESFRPSFLCIPKLLEEFKIRQSLWLTATLPWSYRTELRKLIRAPLIELGHFELPVSIHLKIKKTPWPQRIQTVGRYLLKKQTTGIIFVATRADTERLVRLFSVMTKKKLIAYHAGMSSEERKNAERLIREKAVDTIVATSAFGMGMDYPHLEFVILWQSPPSFLSLVQIIGRVGRGNSTQNEALVLWSPEDFQMLEWTLTGSEKREKKKEELSLLQEFYQSKTCRLKWLQHYFDLKEDASACNRCDNCKEKAFSNQNEEF